ncbi:9638_t:CDS:10 [Funneliformis geosporum]|uniref:9638_t:CDS:1 n=1 Tax=Funneliformis geosporum TaxID=1117311 RepID=A0A9W4SZT2_9GLOM|nr:9638_t:CDS:10 [Funneliformis geosporum]
MLKEKIQNSLLQFEGWEFALSTGQFNLISILKFRRTKDDFTYDKCVEHTEISKFVSYVAETTTDENWKKVASALSEDGMLKLETSSHVKNTRQAQREDVKLFWIIDDNEKVDLDRRLLKNRLEQSKVCSTNTELHNNHINLLLADPVCYDYSESFASSEGQSHGFLSSDISDDLDDLSNSIKSNDHDNDEDEFGVKDKDLFKQRFEALGNSRKWKLKSGRFVEDVLYELGMQCRYHNLVHSFIIDTEDIFIKNEFSKEELSEIVEKSKNKVYWKSTKRFLITSTHLPRVRILEMEPNPLTMDMPEAWHGTESMSEELSI